MLERLGDPSPADDNLNNSQVSQNIAGPSTGADELSQPLSKNAQKKAARAVRIAEQKLERRAREKERKKEKRRVDREERDRKRAAGEDVSERDQQQRKRVKTTHTEPFGAHIVVDLGFDDMMVDKEINSLTSQLAYTYSANRNALKPFSRLLFTSFNGRTRDRLQKQSDAAHLRWTGTEWWHEGYEDLWSGNEESTSSKLTVNKDKVVYLTADAEDELAELREDETYIIGGIVDHNRYKYLCQKKARENGIRSARLPIGKYLSEMTSRKVLTVNQVFEILVKWIETRDWREALFCVMPKRKFQNNNINVDGNNLADDAEVQEVEDSTILEVPIAQSTSPINQDSIPHNVSETI